MNQIYSMKMVCSLTSLSRATVYRKIAEGKFPQPFALGDRKTNRLGQLTGRIGFLAALVDKWIADRVADTHP